MNSINEVLLRLPTLNVSRFGVRNTQLFCLLLSILIFILQLVFSYFTHSLLLFVAALFEFTLVAFIWPLAFSGKRNRQKGEIRKASFLLHFFTIWLLSGHVFFESYSRFTAPVELLSSEALLIAVAGLIGNLFILRTMLAVPIFRKNIHRFRLSLFHLILLFGSVSLAHAVIYLTGFFRLDTLLSCLLGLIIFLWAGFLTMDIYWSILGVGYSKRPLQSIHNQRLKSIN